MKKKTYRITEGFYMWREEQARWHILGEGDSKIGVYSFGRRISVDNDNEYLALPAATVEDGKLVVGSALVEWSLNDERPPVIVGELKPERRGGQFYRDNGMEVSMMLVGKWMGRGNGFTYKLVPAVGVVDGQLAVGFALQAWRAGSSPIAVAVWWEGCTNPAAVDPIWYDECTKVAERMLAKASKMLTDSFGLK